MIDQLTMDISTKSQPVNQMVSMIMITGHARSGKDTFVSLLSAARPGKFKSFAFAHDLKKCLEPICRSMFGKTVFELSLTEKEIFREVMIAFGCAWRKIDSDHWVKIVDKRIDWERSMLFSDPSTQIPIVSDCRFPNECKWFKDKMLGNPTLGRVVVVEIDRFDSGLTPPEEEQRNQPLMKPFVDYIVSWPTNKSKTAEGLKKELMPFAIEFLDKYSL